jgi:hypothetical protein
MESKRDSNAICARKHSPATIWPHQGGKVEECPYYSHTLTKELQEFIDYINTTASLPQLLRNPNTPDGSFMLFGEPIYIYRIREDMFIRKLTACAIDSTLAADRYYHDRYCAMDKEFSGMLLRREPLKGKCREWVMPQEMAEKLQTLLNTTPLLPEDQMREAGWQRVKEVE